MSVGTQYSKFDIFIDKKYINYDNKKKLAVIMFLFIVPFVFCYFVFYQPYAGKIDKLKKQIQVSTEELKKARIAARDLPRHKQELQKTQEMFELTSVLLPKSQEIPDLLRNISDLGKQSGLDFLSFIPSSEVPKDFYAEIPIDIKIRGPYHNLGLFLDKVSKLERIVTVNNIRTEKIDMDGNEVLLTSSCRLLTYRFTNQKVEPVKQKTTPKKKNSESSNKK